MASHLVRNPATAQFLADDETSSGEFKKVFIRGPNRSEVERLRQVGIGYRFAAMTPGGAKMATQLYDVFSRFRIHGGTMRSLTGIALEPTAHSCAFHNRSIDHVAENLPLFKPILPITAIELVDLVGDHGVRSKRINQAGACVLVWLDQTDPRWLERVQAMRKEFGLVGQNPVQ